MEDLAKFYGICELIGDGKIVFYTNALADGLPTEVALYSDKGYCVVKPGLDKDPILLNLYKDTPNCIGEFAKWLPSAKFKNTFAGWISKMPFDKQLLALSKIYEFQDKNPGEQAFYDPVKFPEVVMTISSEADAKFVKVTIYNLDEQVLAAFRIPQSDYDCEEIFYFVGSAFLNSISAEIISDEDQTCITYKLGERAPTSWSKFEMDIASNVFYAYNKDGVRFDITNDYFEILLLYFGIRVLEDSCGAAAMITTNPTVVLNFLTGEYIFGEKVILTVPEEIRKSANWDFVGYFNKHKPNFGSSVVITE